MIVVQPAAKVQTKKTVSSRRGRSACGPPLATYGLIRWGSPGAALVGDADHAFARSGVLQSRRRRQGRRRRVPRAHAPRGAEASTRAPRRVRGPPPRRTPAVRDRDRRTPPPSRARRAETGAERPRAGTTTRPHERWEEWRTLRPPPRRATGRRHGAGGGDEDRQR